MRDDPQGIMTRPASSIATSDIVKGDLAQIHAALGPRVSAFRGQGVVITGAAGFLGFYLTCFFATYAEVLGLRRLIVLDNFQLGKPDWLAALSGHDMVDIHHFDVARDDIGSIPQALDAAFVIHAASIASPTFYRRFPVETIDANIWGLRRLLDAYRNRSSLRGFLFFSSSEIYGDPEPQFIPTAEDYRGRVSCHGPRACYDESKRFGETLCWVYAHEFGMPITVARPFNNYGPGMRVDDRRVPADFAQAVLAGQDILILSDGSPMRTFCYIADAIAGYLLCLLHGRYDYFNIGTAEPEISVRGFAEIYREAAAEVLGYAGAVTFQASSDPAYLTDNPNRRCPDIAKARAMLGYDPIVPVEAGVRRYLRFLTEATRS